MVTGGPTSRYFTGQCHKVGDLTTKGETIAFFAEPNHNSRCHTQEPFKHKVHQCTDCGSVFKDEGQLWCHFRIKHSVSHSVCAQCPRTFDSRQGLTEHMKYAHQRPARYQCEHCGKGYSHHSHYLDHLVAHTGIKRNICPICQRQFTYKRSLKKHQLRFHLNQLD